MIRNVASFNNLGHIGPRLKRSRHAEIRILGCAWRRSRPIRESFEFRSLRLIHRSIQPAEGSVGAVHRFVATNNPNAIAPLA